VSFEEGLLSRVLREREVSQPREGVPDGGVLEPHDKCFECLKIASSGLDDELA
jgi:hypothetical protein